MFDAEHYAISAQQHLSHLKAVRDHQDNLFWHPASSWDQLVYPVHNSWLHNDGFLCSRTVSEMYSTCSAQLRSSPFYISTSATMWGTNTGHRSGRTSIQWIIAAGLLTDADTGCQQGVMRPSSHQHGAGWGSSTNAIMGFGLVGVCKCRIEGA